MPHGCAIKAPNRGDATRLGTTSAASVAIRRLQMDYDKLAPALAVTLPGFACSGLSFVFIGFLYTKIFSYATGKDIGVPAIDSLSAQIRSGASSFLMTEYKFLSVFVLALAGGVRALVTYPPIRHK